MIDFSRPLIVVAFAAMTALAGCKASINKSPLGVLCVRLLMFEVVILAL